ncbi:MAG: hypothetical protein IH591_17865 [Bacteroidales bacterium]|nr:hypothetical protein [Bacteroidales bacterium]
MRSARAWIFAIMILWAAPAHTQDDKLSRAISNIINDLAEFEANVSSEALTEMLMDLALTPVRINSGSESEISRLFFLTPFQVQTLASHIRHTGPLVSPLELASLPGFNRETAEMMLPFIDFDAGNQGNQGQRSTRLGNRLVATTSAGFTDGVTNSALYPARNNIRYRATSGSLSAALTAASDPGEKPLWSGSPDFISGGVAVAGELLPVTFIAGDYTARFGMGLVVNSGYRPLLMVTGTSYMGHRDGFSLSASAGQDNYLRGAAVTIKPGNVAISAFISSRFRDARLKTDVAGEEYTDILATTPVHNTLSGQTASGVLRESSYGLSAGFGTGHIRYAVTACLTDFSHNINEGGESPEAMYNFSGSRCFNAGVSYRMAFGRVTGAGEAALADNGAIATAHTLNIRFDDRFTANIIYRNYPRDYYGHLAGGPGRGSSTTNEEGLLARVTFEAARNLFLNAGTDIYHFPWLRYNTSFPSSGFRGELRASYIGWKSVTAEARISTAQTIRNAATATGVATEEMTRQTTSKFIITHSPSSSLSISINASHKFASTGTPGTLLAADINYSPGSLPVAFWFRHAMYSTGSYETGIYLYENDMLYGFSVPVHYGEGSRSALVLKIMPGRNAEVRLKYGITTRETGSGCIRQQELKTQVSLRF